MSGAGQPTRTDLSAGTVYTDLARTAGALTWVWTGDAWEVLRGDTGRQDLDSWETGWTHDPAQTYVQRVGDMVTLFIGATNEATGTVWVATLPEWARPASDFAAPWAYGDLASVLADGRIRGWATTASPGTQRYWTCSWPTSNDWPTAFVVRQKVTTTSDGSDDAARHGS